MPLKVDEHGYLDRASVNSLSLNEFREWINARLHGQERHVPADARQGEYPHYLFVSIYPELDRDSRDYIRNVVTEFLYDMSRNPGSAWRGDPAHALLMLAQGLRAQEFQLPIYEMAESGRFFDKTAPPSEDIHRRLLQSLTMLNWRCPVNFWYKQFGISQNNYAGVVFSGLAQIDLQYAIHLLPHLFWNNEDVQDQMRSALRALLPAYEHSRIGQLLSSIMPKLSFYIQGIILDMLPELRGFIERPQWSGFTDFIGQPLRVNVPAIRQVLSEQGQQNFKPQPLFL